MGSSGKRRLVSLSMSKSICKYCEKASKLFNTIVVAVAIVAVVVATVVVAVVAVSVSVSVWFLRLLPTPIWRYSFIKIVVSFGLICY